MRENCLNTAVFQKKKKIQLVRFYFRILSRTIKPQNEIEYENKFWKVEFDSCLY